MYSLVISSRKDTEFLFLVLKQYIYLKCFDKKSILLRNEVQKLHQNGKNHYFPLEGDKNNKI